MQKRTWVLFLMLIGLLVAVAAMQQCRLLSLQNDLDTLNASYEMQLIRIQSDEAFIQGDTAVAYRLYGNLSNDSLLQRRQATAKIFWGNNAYDSTPRKTNAPKSTAPIAAGVPELLRAIDSLSQLIQREEPGEATSPLPRHSPPMVMELRQKEFLQFSTAKKGETINYLGEMKNDKANGKGVAVWKNGSTYQGDWKDNLRHGIGVFTWADGEKYTGDYENDLRQGTGTYITKNGERYEGEWAADKRDGAGRLYDKSGKLKLEGIWKADKLAKVVKEY
ncbi:MAG: hypothetical protein KF852_14250 [Saprospiraceae bacterium]|nr:hypothetical protein [Saprospiraceae bacterium]